MADESVMPEAMPLPAEIIPPLPVEPSTEIKENEIVMSMDDRRYRVRGLEKNLSYETLRVNLLVNRGTSIHIDTFDLYSAKHRGAFIQLAASELNVDLGILKRDLGKVLLKLEVLQDQHIQQTLMPAPKKVELSEKDEKEAMALLQSPRLIDRILEDYQTCGVVGENTNKLVGYLAALSRKLEKPLAVMVQSTSAAGKSALMDAVLSFIPEEDRAQYSAMTGQSLFYMGNLDLKHKILAINEEEGAAKAAYALKLLQSDGRLTIASTGKDPHSGRHVTHEYNVEGPVMIFSTTTAIDIDEELLNRCLVLTVDEDRKQTRAIHDYQRFEETLDGMLAAQARDAVLRVHRNAQRLLRPLKVVNPFAEQLTFLDDKTRTRRDHKKYLTLIRSIALLHQYQREIHKTYFKGKPIEYIEVTVDDIELANRIAHDVLGRSLDDLPPQTRRLLMLIDEMVSDQCEVLDLPRNRYRFGRREIREHTGWGHTQLTVHLQRLERQEYLLIHRGGRGQRRVYELLYRSEGQDGQPFLMGLTDIDTLKTHRCDEKCSGQNAKVSGLNRPIDGVSAVPGSPRPTASFPRLGRLEPCLDILKEPNAYPAQKNENHTVTNRRSEGAAT
ncbi:MAG: DNA primase [Gammaproteobacteria bacterium]|nr:DNA primase [Gammaproteobacteria bacterium]